MKKLLVGMLLFFVAAAAPLFAAGAMKPVAFVTIQDYKALTGSVSVIAEKLGYKEMFDTMFMLFGQTEGIDETRPAGVVVLADHAQILPFGFVPVTDFSNSTFPGSEALKEKYDSSSRTLTIGEGSGGKVLSVLPRGSYSVLVQQGKENLIPDGDPIDLLEGVRSDCMVCAKVYPTRVPQAAVETLMTPLMTQIADQPEEAETFENQIDTILSCLRQFESLGFALKVDAGTGDLVWLFDCNAADGSELADIFPKMKDRQTVWGDLFRPDDDVVALLGNSLSTESMVKQSRESIKKTFGELIEKILDDEEEWSEEERQNVSEILENIASFIDKTNAMGKSDGVFSLTTDPQLIIAGTIAGGDDLTKAIGLLGKELAAEQGDDDSILKQLKLNAKSYKGYTISTFVLKSGECEGLTELNPDLAGTSPSILLAVKDDTLVLVAGLDQKNVGAKFKAIIERESTPSTVPPMNFRFSMKNLGVCAAGLLPEDQDNASEDQDPISKVVAMASQADPNAAIYETVTYDGSTGCQGEFVITGSFIAEVGKILQSFKTTDDDDDDWDLNEEEE